LAGTFSFGIRAVMIRICSVEFCSGVLGVCCDVAESASGDVSVCMCGSDVAGGGAGGGAVGG